MKNSAIILFFRLFDSSKLVKGLNIAILNSKFSSFIQLFFVFFFFFFVARYAPIQTSSDRKW